MSSTSDGFSGSWKPDLFMVLFLCLSVMVLMLGVPITLLNLSIDSDILSASVLEGFSVPPGVIRLEPVVTAVMTIEIQPTVDRPILISSLFHPPIV